MNLLTTILLFLGGLLIGYLLIVSLFTLGVWWTILWLVAFYFLYIKFIDWWFDE